MPGQDGSCPARSQISRAERCNCGVQNELCRDLFHPFTNLVIVLSNLDPMFFNVAGAVVNDASPGLRLSARLRRKEKGVTCFPLVLQVQETGVSKLVGAWESRVSALGPRSALYASSERRIFRSHDNFDM